MKQKIKITILTLAVFLLFSCQIEEEVIKRDINLQNFKVEQKSYHELMQTIIFTKAISDLTNKSQTRNPKSEQQSKTIMETQYGFTILDSPVNITETNEIVSYTILIKSDSKIDVACFENLVMNVNKQSNILSAYLLKHKLAGTENQNNHPKSLIKSETTIKPIVFNNANYNSKIDTSCYTIFIPTCQKPWENYGEEDPYPYVEPHPLTAECLEDINYITVEELQICIDSFGPDDDTPNPINDSQNPNSNNNYGGSSNSSNVITAPVVPTYTSVNLTTELSLNQEQQDWINNPAQFKIKKALQIYLFNNNSFGNNSIENQQFVISLINYLLINPSLSFESVFFNRTQFDNNSNMDLNNNSIGGYDNTNYDIFNPNSQPWPTIPNVIDAADFVGWGAPSVTRNCMDYAKAQIAKKGYQISNFYDAGQTIQIYTEQNGADFSTLVDGISYIEYALSNNIPVIVGVDDNPGNPGNPDNTTDHFIVIVGMGSNANGNYFQFFDNASGDVSQGTSPLNLLYYNPVNGQISGTSECSSYFSSVSHNYIITHIRKSKTL